MGSCDDDDDNDDDLAAEQRSRVFLEKGQEKKSALNNLTRDYERAGEKRTSDYVSFQ